MKKKKLLLVFLAVFCFAACKDDPPVAPPEGDTDNYFGTPNGYEWVYSNDSLAVDNSVHPLNKYDTLKQDRDTTYLGRGAKLMKHHFVNVFNGTTSSTNYRMFEDGSKVYVSQEFLGLFLPNFLVEVLDVLDTIKLADGTAKSWNLTEIEVPDLDISDLDIPLDISKISGKFNIGFTRGDEFVKVGCNSRLFTMKVAFNGNLEAKDVSIPYNGTLIPIGDIDVPFETIFSEIDFYLSQGKGLIEINAKPMEVKVQLQLQLPIPIPLPPIEYPLMNIPGVRKTLKID
jgi:hypothetical protein